MISYPPFVKQVQSLNLFDPLYTPSEDARRGFEQNITDLNEKLAAKPTTFQMTQGMQEKSREECVTDGQDLPLIFSPITRHATLKIGHQICQKTIIIKCWASLTLSDSHFTGEFFNENITRMFWRR